MSEKATIRKRGRLVTSNAMDVIGDEDGEINGLVMHEHLEQMSLKRCELVKSPLTAKDNMGEDIVGKAKVE